MEDFEGFGKLELEDVPVFPLPMGFLNSDNIEIMDDPFYGTNLCFSPFSGSPSAVSRPLAFHEAKVIEEASQGSTRLVSLATACCGGGWRVEAEGVVVK